ncbi:MAG: DUF2007 domain-containing protein [Lentisphaerae bacterium]|jgi:hypothetical protein|nr:DUF2007 domain-containing protein [Lentisphaerota bacterium]MBT4817893.1 DUF2007 domain-containing protein [Lentisphaerota bacterium]MBT5605397.1 DUF2007 domain-containing protein [Lentisphaerota bacterium]MBT7062021.1 DUF2007 domain-containing protein [Lentisphaerota bacterium]MBT7848609.1 DUF2007 domain-containing protein [Lentisphaerota bacterium]
MKKMATDIDFARIGLMQSALEESGIPTLMRNQELSQLAGALPQGQVWPELWILDDDDYEAAKSLLEDIAGN